MYLVRKIQQGQADRLGKLKTVHLFMERWYVRELENVQHQSRVRKYQDSKNTSIYHQEVRHLLAHDLLIHPVKLDQAAQQALLAEDASVFSHEDNKKHLIHLLQVEFDYIQFDIDPSN